MMQEVTRYPLQWPTGWKRTPGSDRKRARFSRDEVRQGTNGGTYTRRRDLTVADSVARLASELRMLGASDEVLSTNVQVRLDGLPRSGQGEPVDPGAAVYFTLKGKPRCLACDRWNRVADNLAAIAAHVEAIRAVDRYGVGTMEQAFAGYAQLPPAATDWRSVFGIAPDVAVEIQYVEDRYRELAKKAHPDAGGSHDLMARLTQAREAARAELGAP